MRARVMVAETLAVVLILSSVVALGYVGGAGVYSGKVLPAGNDTETGNGTMVFPGNVSVNVDSVLGVPSAVTPIYGGIYEDNDCGGANATCLITYNQSVRDAVFVLGNYTAMETSADYVVALNWTLPQLQNVTTVTVFDNTTYEVNDTVLQGAGNVTLEFIPTQPEVGTLSIYIDFGFVMPQAVLSLEVAIS